MTDQDISDASVAEAPALTPVPEPVAEVALPKPLTPGELDAAALWPRVRPGNAANGRLGELAAAATSGVAPARWLRVRGMLCLSCGADCDKTATTCPSCGRGVGKLSTTVADTLGDLHLVRKNLRKRLVVRIGTEDENAVLLHENGETVTVAPSELLPAESVPIPEDVAPVRSPRGRLVRLATAVDAGGIKQKFDSAKLIAVACEGISDELTGRLLAADVFALGRLDLLSRIPMTESERDWLRAVHATAAGDVPTAVATIGRLPVDRYRPKLSLLAKLAPAALVTQEVDTSALLAQVRPFVDSEPLAGVLERALGRANQEAPAAPIDVALVTGQQRRMLGALPIPDDTTAALQAGIDLLTGSAESVPNAGYHARSMRVLDALADPTGQHVAAADLGHLPLSILDDLIDRGAVSRAMVQAAIVDPERDRYLRARLAADLLTDDEVLALDHVAERARRAFVRSDDATLAELADRADVRHYKSLVAARRGRLAEVDLDAVEPAARPIVERLLELVAVRDAGGSITERLTPEILADPTVWPIVLMIAGPSALQASDELRARFPAFTEWLSLHQAREYLFRGEWRDAVAAADRCLSLAQSEPVCDEALNLKACAHYNSGDHMAAIAALENAIEGAYSENLLANISIVAQFLQPELATTHLGRLMVEAPTIALRVAAAHRALGIWSNTDTTSWKNSDDSPLPDAFQDALHDLLVRDIPLKDFRQILVPLSWQDQAWLGEPSNLARSPHAETLEARFYTGRARSIYEMIGVMGAALRAGDPPQWLTQERTQLQSDIFDVVYQNLDEPDSMVGNIALEMVTEGVLLTPYDNLLFTFMGLASVTYHLTMSNNELADAQVSRLNDARRSLSSLSAEERGRIDAAVELATRRVALNRMGARDSDMRHAVELYNSGLALGRDAMTGSPAYLEALRRIGQAADIARRTHSEMAPWLPLIEHDGAREDIRKTVEHAHDLERHARDLL